MEKMSSGTGGGKNERVRALNKRGRIGNGKEFGTPDGCRRGFGTRRGKRLSVKRKTTNTSGCTGRHRQNRK